MDQEQWIPDEHYREAAAAVKTRIRRTPFIGLILGSGLGTFVEEITDPDVIPYEEIPHWPSTTVVGHAGKLVIGQLENRTVLAMQGRIHFYEGNSMSQVTLPVRVMRLLGVNTLIVTNAAGGLNPAFDAGDIMLIEDHIFLPGLAGHTPLRGPNLSGFGPRFSSHTHSYSPELRRLARQAAATHGITLHEGVYVSLSGPAFETPAEVRMLRAWGADAVGMSTAPEVLVASHAGMRVLGLSTITNKSIDNTETSLEISHEEVLRLGRQVVPKLATLIRTVLRELPPYDPAAAENHPET